jgi:transposase
MGRKATAIELSEEDRLYLQKITRNRTAQHQEVQRAKILLMKADGLSDGAIADKLEINSNSVRLCIMKYNENGVSGALKDKDRAGRPNEITDAEIAWILATACQRPTDLGYSQELWTITNLHTHITKHALENSCPRLGTVARSTVHQILSDAEIKPHKIRYYLEKRDEEFETKMKEVLVVYKQIELEFDENGNVIPFEGFRTVTVSYDEKPGIQAIANTAEDLRPTSKHGYVSRDHEYKRLGTLSLLAGIDLLTGEAMPLVSDTHKSSDFIEFLKILDSKYPKEYTIRIILDNHSAHTSKETKRFLATMPERFVLVFTPKHGSWLNLIECFFSRMSRQMLRGIRVKSKEELCDRIYLYFNEINADPVVFRWKYRMNDKSTPTSNEDLSTVI